MIWAAVLGALRRVPPWLVIVVAVLAWGGVQRWQAKRHATAAAQATQAAQQQAAAASAERDAREREHTAAEAARKAADAYSQNLRRVQGAAVAARTERDRLLIAADAAASAPCAARTPGAAASGSDGAAALRVVVGECATALSAVAEAADACDARLTALQAWAREVPKVCR
jgi:predicted membrane metal-binding protein